MKDILKLLRVHHYIKNLLVFIPLFFSGRLFDRRLFVDCLYGFIAFSLISSVVYILNDIRDIEKDRKHEKKRHRPIASGHISIKKASAIAGICLVVALTICVVQRQWLGMIILIVYLFLNILYSFGLKCIPIVDIVILASGFVLRIIYGGVIANIEISRWLFLVVVVGSLFMGLGKRRNELIKKTDTRDVLKYYSESFLDKNMYVCVALVDVFYAMWSLEAIDSRSVWTIPIIIIIMMKYSLDIEGESDGDPIEVIIRDKILILLVLIYAICIFTLLYII